MSQEVKKVHGNTVYPVDKINFELPNGELTKIWGLPQNYAANMRAKLEVGEAKWDLRRAGTMNDPALRKALGREKQKAAHFQRNRKK
jgi:hypothetical protein